MTLSDDAPAVAPVTPSVLRQARERVRLAPDQAEDIASKLLAKDREQPVSAGEILSWEDGASQPTIVQAEVLAKTYLIPFVDLFQPELPPQNVADFRLGPEGRAVPMSYDTLEKLSRFAKLYMVAKRVHSGLGLPEEAIVPTVRLSDIAATEDVELIASDVRASLGISDDLQISWGSDEDALSEWRERVEEVGIFVFSLPMAVAECRGVSIWEPQGPPAILLNSSDGTTAQLFTLMHEYAHLMLSERRGAMNLCDPSRAARNEEERMANRFAAAALLPRSLILPRVPQPVPGDTYSNWPNRYKRRLRKALNVSNAAIAIRLKELAVVSDAGLQTFWRKPSKFVPRGVRRPLWQRYRRYLGSHTTRLAKQAVDSEAISAVDLSRILDMKVRDVEAMLV